MPDGYRPSGWFAANNGGPHILFGRATCLEDSERVPNVFLSSQPSIPLDPGMNKDASIIHSTPRNSHLVYQPHQPHSIVIDHNVSIINQLGSYMRPLYLAWCFYSRA